MIEKQKVITLAAIAVSYAAVVLWDFPRSPFSRKEKILLNVLLCFVYTQYSIIKELGRQIVFKLLEGFRRDM